MSKEKKSLDEIKKNKLTKILGIFFSLITGSLVLIFKKNIILSIGAFIIAAILFFVFNYFRKVLEKAHKIEEMERVFPDFLQLVAGNLRAGITIDKAILLSARKEFSPLDKEIMMVGKDITTGRSMEVSLTVMAKRIGSDRINKTILLITSGLRAGGNLAILLERTASNMREREFVEKRAASNVLMYVIFIFVAVSIGAPALFSLSTILVETMTGILSSAPSLDTTVSSLNVPFSFSKINISLDFIIYYSIAFMLVIGTLSSLVIGLVSKGSEKAGLKYIPQILIIALVIFFSVRYFLSGFVSGIF